MPQPAPEHLPTRQGRIWSEGETALSLLLCVSRGRLAARYLRSAAAAAVRLQDKPRLKRTPGFAKSRQAAALFGLPASAELPQHRVHNAELALQLADQDILLLAQLPRSDTFPAAARSKFCVYRCVSVLCTEKVTRNRHRAVSGTCRQRGCRPISASPTPRPY